MKKINIIAVILIFSSVFSVFANTPANRMDSLNYALGIVIGHNAKNYLDNEVTEAKINSLLKGVDDVMNNNSEYYALEMLATNIGSAMKEQKEGGFMGLEDKTVNMDVLKQGLVNGIKGHENQMTVQEANSYIQVTMRAEEAAAMEKQYSGNKKAGEEFLAENAKKEGVVTLPSGLQYKIIKEGNGEIPTATSNVVVHYHGTLIDGTVFDSSVERAEPAHFGVTQVIRGWTEALQMMPVGSKWMLYIPYDLAYGSRGPSPVIEPYSALVFEVELLGIE